MGVLVRQGKLRTLTTLVNATLQDWDFRLFRNDIVPVNGTLVADMVEATFGGYSAINWGVWTDAYARIDPHVGSDRIGNLIWQGNNQGPAQSIYGWYVTWGGEELVYAERFAQPKTMLTAGDRIELAMSVVYGQLVI